MKQQQYKLDKIEIQATGLLSIGTFLEYFDLMLYVHMAVLLNELFFPKSDPDTAMLLGAFSFCSTFVFRPIGALLFGWIGDNVGRKATVVFTTIMMALSCMIMANLPTYNQIGITAAWLITICRALQGMSSVGEVVGAALYLTELTKPPIQYPVVSFISVASVIGTVAALGLASLVTLYSLNWRIAFWFGCIIAGIGTWARTSLRETKDFVDAKRRATDTLQKLKGDLNVLKTNPFVNEKVSKKTSFYLFIIQCGWPICMYFSYIHCGNVLKTSFGYTAEQVIHQNFFISLIHLFKLLFLCLLTYKVNPLTIVKIKWWLFVPFICFCPYLLSIACATNNSSIMFLVQTGIIVLSIDADLAAAIFYKHFPVFKRFTYTSLIYALSRVCMYIVTSFGLVYLVKYFNHYGILILLIPVMVLSWFSCLYFEKLENERLKGLII